MRVDAALVQRSEPAEKGNEVSGGRKYLHIYLNNGEDVRMHANFDFTISRLLIFAYLPVLIYHQKNDSCGQDIMMILIVFILFRGTDNKPSTEVTYNSIQFNLNNASFQKRTISNIYIL